MYDFDTVYNRRHTDSLKWDVAENELPMWVADMDFPTAPSVREALARRMENGIFGYTEIPDAWYEAYQGWWEDRHQFKIEKDWLVFCSGVVPAISSAVRKLTTPAEKVLVMTPVYNIFFNSILNNGRVPLESPLVYDGNVYHINWGDLEEKLADPQTSMMILCNPQNPTGNIWDRETLMRIGELCLKYHVTVISDEIHCDLTSPGVSYVPFAAVSDVCREISVTCLAPTKAFNIAGLQTAAMVIPDPTLRHRMWRAVNTDEVAEPNSFSVDAAIAAFTQGRDWFDDLRAYLKKSRDFCAKFIGNQIPQIHMVPSDATYLLWLDVSRLGGTSTEIASFLRSRTGLFVTDGAVYRGDGDHFLRMNIACPMETLKDGLERLKRGCGEFRK